MANHVAAPDKHTVAYFDSVARRYDDLYDDRTPGGFAFTLRRQRVLEIFDRPEAKVLDVGCGTGVMFNALSAQGCDFWGIDPSPNMVEQAKENFADFPNAHFAIGSAEKVDFPDNSFDAVLCMGVLERVTDNDLALSELTRVLKPGGTLIVTLPNKFSPYYLWRDYVYYPAISMLRPIVSLLRPGGRGQEPVIPGHTLYSAKAYAEAVEQKDCVVKGIEFCAYNSLFVPPMDIIFPKGAVWAMKKLEGLRRSFLKNTASCIIIKAQKNLS